MNHVHVGIDPGANGAAVALWPDEVVWTCRDEVLRGEDLNDDAVVWRWLSGLVGSAKVAGVEVRAALEIAPTAIFGADKSSGAKLYGCYRGLRMALAASGLAFTEVRAVDWQRGMGVERRGNDSVGPESRVQWKNRLKQKAKELFPNNSVTLATADAFLIAEWLRQRSVRVRSREPEVEEVVL